MAAELGMGFYREADYGTPPFSPLKDAGADALSAELGAA